MVVERNELRLFAEPLGKGGQASVFGIVGRPAEVVKIYNDRTVVHRSSLEELVSWRSGLGDGDRQLLDKHCAWPREVVLDGDQTSGVILPVAPEGYWIKIGEGSRLAELQYLILAERSKKMGVSIPDPHQRALIISSLADVLDLFERHKIVHGDISHKNALWAVSPEASCYLLDCDSASLGGSLPPLASMTTPHWTDPRISRGEISSPDVDSDRLALALAFYRTYFQKAGNFRADGSLGSKAPILKIEGLAQLSPKLAELLKESLVHGAPRPPAARWRIVADMPTYVESATTPARDAPASTQIVESDEAVAVDLMAGGQPTPPPSRGVPLPTWHGDSPAAAMGSVGRAMGRSGFALLVLIFCLAAALSGAITFVLVLAL